MFGNSPSLMMESLWQMPQACTLIRTVPGPGSGIGRSTISKGPFGRETWATRILAIVRSSGRTPSWTVFPQPSVYAGDQTGQRILCLSDGFRRLPEIGRFRLRLESSERGYLVRNVRDSPCLSLH